MGRNKNDEGANRKNLREGTIEDEALLEKVYTSEEAAGWQLPSSLIREPAAPKKKISYARRSMNKKNGYVEEDYFSRSLLGNLRKAFYERDYPVIESSLVEPSPSYNNNNNNNNNRDINQDYQPDVFLLHAKLFVFAEKYDIQPLKILAIHNLHHSLSHYQLLPQHVSDMTNLIHYSYENTHASSDDLLRELLASYVEIEMAVLIEAKPFEELLEEGGDFVGDFLKRVKKRIS